MHRALALGCLLRRNVTLPGRAHTSVIRRGSGCSQRRTCARQGRVDSPLIHRCEEIRGYRPATAAVSPQIAFSPLNTAAQDVRQKCKKQMRNSDDPILEILFRAFPMMSSRPGGPGSRPAGAPGRGSVKAAEAIKIDTIEVSILSSPPASVCGAAPSEPQSDNGS